MNSMNKIIGMFVGAAIIAGAFFYGGMAYGKSQMPSARLSGQPGQSAQFRGAMGGARSGSGFVSGSILSKDGSSMTIQTQSGQSGQSGGSKVVFFSSSTEISKPMPVDVVALAAGENVIVTGTANADGSITAQTIQVRSASERPTVGSAATGR